MSNEPTIQQIEMNMVICEFMGGYQGQHNVPFYVGPDGFEHESGEFLKYHSSWDWLMPAWDELRRTIWREFDADYPKEFISAAVDWKAYCAVVNIKKAHETLYELIQWYNKQNK